MGNSESLKGSANPNSSAIRAEDIRSQVDKIIASRELEKSTRLQELLDYIVTEYIAGRADRIKGFTIARAVFSAPTDFDADTNSIVRVEAGRLRGRLEEYYRVVGGNDPIIVDIPKGSYVPRFRLNPKHRADDSSSLTGHKTGKQNKYIWMIVAVLVMIVLLIMTWQNARDPEVIGDGEEVREQVQGPANRSEATVLFQQAFELMMPPEDGSRLNASLELFERVIEIDSEFAGGYAGKSIALSMKVIFIKSDAPSRDLDSALMMAQNAIDIAPGYGLGYAALSLPLALKGEADPALANVKRTLAIRPRDPGATGVASITLVIIGQPLQAIELLSEAIRLNPNNTRTPYLNLLGIAQYVTGDYTAALKSFEKNLTQSGPSGPHMDVFLAAAYLRMNKSLEAQAIMEKMLRTDPDYPIVRWLNNFIKSEEEVRETVDQLLALAR